MLPRRPGRPRRTPASRRQPEVPAVIGSERPARANGRRHIRQLHPATPVKDQWSGRVATDSKPRGARGRCACPSAIAARRQSMPPASALPLVALGDLAAAAAAAGATCEPRPNGQRAQPLPLRQGQQLKGRLAIDRD